jgi:ribosomal protein L22
MNDSDCFPLPFFEGLWFYDPKSETFFPSSLISQKKKAEIAKIRKRLGSRLTSHRRRSLAKSCLKALQEKERFSKRIALVKEKQSLTFQNLREEVDYVIDVVGDWDDDTLLFAHKIRRADALKAKAFEKASKASIRISSFRKPLQNDALKLKTFSLFAKSLVLATKKRILEKFKKFEFALEFKDWLETFSDYSLNNQKMASVLGSVIENAEREASKRVLRDFEDDLLSIKETSKKILSEVMPV